MSFIRTTDAKVFLWQVIDKKEHCPHNQFVPITIDGCQGFLKVIVFSNIYVCTFFLNQELEISEIKK